MPATEDNPKGYWESSRLMELNDRILASAGSNWCDWRPFNSEWFDTPLADVFRDEARQAIEEEFPKQPLFVLKDPRICRFLPLWLGALNGAEIDAKVVLSVRHPVEVAMSLAKRDGLSPSIGHLLWLRHVLDAEYFSRDTCRSIVLWDEFLKQPGKCMKRLSEQLKVKWPRHRDFALLDAKTFVSGDLRHNDRTHAPAPVFLSDLGDEVYELLEAMAQNDSGAERRRLDEIREKLSIAAEILGPLLAPAERMKQPQLTVATNVGLLARGDAGEDLQVGEGYGLFLPPVKDDMARVEQLRSELEIVQGRLARSESALQESISRVAEAEARAEDVQRALELAQFDRREVLRKFEDTSAMLDTAQANLVVSQDKLRDETVKAALATEQVERLSAECIQVKSALQDVKSSMEAAHKAALQAAREQWNREASSRLARLGKTALDALRLASELVRQSNDRLAQHVDRLNQFERQHAEMLHRALPAWVPFDKSVHIVHGSRRLSVKRLVVNWQTSRLVTKGDEANKSKNWPLAAVCYARALAKSPSLAPIWVQYGHALKELGDRGLAEVAYREAIRLQPNNPDTHLHLGHLLKLLGRVEAARAAFQRSAELDPSQVHLRRELAVPAEPQDKPSFDFLDNAMQAVMREAAGSDAAHQKM